MMYCNKFVAVVKVDGKVLREDKGVVYIPFGSEYSILLKNLNSKKVSVDISIDDEDILAGRSLIIDPNSDLELHRWLDGGLDAGPKLKFIEKTESIREYRGENNGMDGILRISYRYEKEKPVITWRENPYYPFDNKGDNWYKPVQFHTYYGSGTTDRHFSSTDCSNYTESVSFVDSSCNAPSTLDEMICDNINDEGITIKGEEINQKFTESTPLNLEDKEDVIIFQLKGEIRFPNYKKPITVKTKIKCKKCGKVNKWNDNYCSVCGNNLKY